MTVLLASRLAWMVIDDQPVLSIPLGLPLGTDVGAALLGGRGESDSPVSGLLAISNRITTGIHGFRRRFRQLSGRHQRYRVSASESHAAAPAVALPHEAETKIRL